MKLQPPDIGPWMLKRWIFLFCITACLFVLLIESSLGSRLLACIGLLIFMQLQEISYVQDLDTVRVAFRSPRAARARKKKAAAPSSIIPSELDLQARRDFASWSLSSPEHY